MSASVARILGGLLYYAPDSAAVEPFLAALTRLPELADWPEEDEVPYWCRVLHLTTEDKAYSFRVLFTAPEQGLAPVPPWGSVYQDAENRLDAASTRRYRAFLQTQQLLLHHTAGEPEDHIGLMLLTLAYLLEQEREEAVIELLREHLLPWSWRFVQLLQQASEGDFYPALSRILGGFLAELEYQLEICLPMIRLYR